jgi:fructoselysine-6-P-deglycase FrlB-like protein
MTMSQLGIHTLNEIRTSPDAWTGTLATVDAAAHHGTQLLEDAEEVVIAGCGSGQNASCAIAPF